MHKIAQKRKDIDVVLVYPKTGMDLGATIAPPHGLLAIAAPLVEKGYKVKIIDQRLDPQWESELVSVLKCRPICAGISTMTGTQIAFAYQAAQLIRRHTDGNIPIVWGGAHPSSIPEQTLEDENVDIVCIGEGDIAFLEIVEALQAKKTLNDIAGIGFKNANKITITPSRPLLDVETLLPIPWELIDIEPYIHPDFYLKGSSRSLDVGQTSRGCPFQCGFCSSASIRRRKWRPMSVEKSLETILEPVRKFGLNGVWIRDDEFYISRKRTREICEGIIDSGLKFNWYSSGTRVDTFNKQSDEEIELLLKSGALNLKFGAESGCNRILKLINKGITKEETINANLRVKKYEINPVFAFMIGFPTETFEEINQTLDLITKLKNDNPESQIETIAPYTALPSTPMYPLALEMGLKPPEKLIDWRDWVIDDSNTKKNKRPWFSYKDRKTIANICYISMLSNAVSNAIGGIKNSCLRFVLRIFYKPFAVYYRLRLRRKFFKFSLDLAIIRFLRKQLFYKGHFTIK